MPYIKTERRIRLDASINRLVDKLWLLGQPVKGDLNYVVTRLVLAALKPEAGWNYQSLSDAVGALQDAADEIKRRMLAPYEDHCIKRNGDIEELQG